MINRCGFNSHGLRAAHERLLKRETVPLGGRRGILGVNVGKNKLSEVTQEGFEEEREDDVP